MKLKISEVAVFKALFLCVTRFAEIAHFDIQKTGIRIRSIDPHDFCYVDVRLSPSFFEGYVMHEDRFSFGADVGKLKQMLVNVHKDKPLYLEINEGNLQLHLVNKWKTTYKLDWLDTDPYDLPEPLRLEHKVHINIPSEDFFRIIKDASTVSHEICFSALNGKLEASSENQDFSFKSKIDVGDGISKIDNRAKISRTKPVTAFAIIDYLKTLHELIALCDSVQLGIENELPLRLDISYRGRSSFTFLISNRKLSRTAKQRRRREGMSIPHLSVTKLPEFLEFIETSAEGVDANTLKLAQLETAGGDYTRLATMLDFISKKNGKIFLTIDGKKFVFMLREAPEKARQQLHITALKKLPQYEVIMRHLIERPLSTNEIHDKVNSTLEQKSLPKLSHQDLIVLLGLGTWCKVVDRKMALYYFGKDELQTINSN